MRWIVLSIFASIVACNNKSQKDTSWDEPRDSIIKPVPGDTTTIIDSSKTYSNKRFRNVTIKKTGDNQFLITGEAQVWEASFNWVIADGRNELKQGYTTTDAGAPEWGRFSFTVEATSRRPNSTLQLTLFESSAKDGSRQYQLSLPLY